MINKRKSIIWILSLISLIFLNSCSGRQFKNFNVVLIVIDTVRSDHLPIYGYRKNTSPFLMDLSRKSVVFANAFSASSWTAPATASIFTSLYPFQHGVYMGLLALKIAREVDPYIETTKIPDSITTIGEVMKEGGYNTYGVSDNNNICQERGFTKGFDKFEVQCYQGAPWVNQLLEDWKDQIAKGGKYFLYIHYMDPHAPYHQRFPWYKPFEDFEEDKISAHDSEINYVDQHIKELFELYEWDKNTMIIITSDHGEGLWDHGKMGHGNTLYREEIQVPLMIYFPDGEISKRISSNVSTIDILPTLRELIGLPKDNDIEGVSLMDLVDNKKSTHDERYLYPYLWKKMVNNNKNKSKIFEVEYRAILYKSWHYIIRMPRKRRLFHLVNDKTEQNNVIKKRKKYARLLSDKFNTFLKNCKKYQQKTVKYRLDKKEVEKLKALGYVQKND